jgi:DNA replication protein DnaC
MTAKHPWQKPYPYETPVRMCAWQGCKEPATDRYIRYEDRPDSVGLEIRLCEEHTEVQKALTEKYCRHRFLQQNQRMYLWSLETFPADDAAGKAAKEAAVEWMDELSSECNLFIHGPVGSGKTGLAWGIGREIAINSHWDPPKFVNVRQLLTKIRRSFGDADGADPMDELVDVWTLILDDLGAERVTDWTREWLATLIEGRYSAAHSTIVTSNYSPSQLARRLGHDDPIIGKRIVSRLVEDAVIIKLDRADLRLRKAA